MRVRTESYIAIETMNKQFVTFSEIVVRINFFKLLVGYGGSRIFFKIMRIYEPLNLAFSL